MDYYGLVQDFECSKNLGMNLGNQRRTCLNWLMSLHPAQLEGRDWGYCAYIIYTSAVCMLWVCITGSLAYMFHLATGWTCKQEQQQGSGREEIPWELSLQKSASFNSDHSYDCFIILLILRVQPSVLRNILSWYISMALFPNHYSANIIWAPE